MTRKLSVVIEQDEHGCYAWCPELKGCQSQGETIEDAIRNIREAAELYLETLSPEDRIATSQQSRPHHRDRSLCLRSRLTAAEAEAMLLRAGFVHLRSKGSHRIYKAGERRVVVPFHAGITLHPKTAKEVIDAIAESSSGSGSRE